MVFWSVLLVVPVCHHVGHHARNHVVHLVHLHVDHHVYHLVHQHVGHNLLHEAPWWTI